MTDCRFINRIVVVAALSLVFTLETSARAQSASIENWAMPSPASTSSKVLSTRQATPKPLATPAAPKPISLDPPSPRPPAVKGGGLQIQGVPGANVPWSIVIMLTALTLIPAILLCVTPFARLLIVFHFLRQALGLQTTPSNQTLIGLSLILTFYLMHPVAAQIYQSAVIPAESGQMSATDALKIGEEPLRKFMTHYVRDKDVALFVDLAKEPRPASVDNLSLHILLPAYILSELKAGFQIGTVLFLPFLIVDMVVASITTSVGMLQLPPVVISTPLKLLLFLMVDGWHLLIGSLMRSFT
jgi:flagellar biosynthetic protein FliP